MEKRTEEVKIKLNEASHLDLALVEGKTTPRHNKNSIRESLARASIKLIFIQITTNRIGGDGKIKINFWRFSTEYKRRRSLKR